MLYELRGDIIICILFLGLARFAIPINLSPLYQNESKCESIQKKMSSACSFIFMQIKVTFLKMVSHLDSLWNRGTRKLGNGLLASRDGAVMRVLPLHQCGLDSIPAQTRGLSLLLVLAVLWGFFSGFSSYPSTKINNPYSSSTRIDVLHENQLRLMWLPLLRYLLPFDTKQSVRF